MKKSTLMNKSKKELVDHIMCLEHNLDAIQESFNVQYQNCMRLIDDMSLVNKTYKQAFRVTQIAEEQTCKEVSDE